MKDLGKMGEFFLPKRMNENIRDPTQEAGYHEKEEGRLDQHVQEIGCHKRERRTEGDPPGIGLSPHERGEEGIVPIETQQSDEKGRIGNQYERKGKDHGQDHSIPKMTQIPRER